MSKLLPTIALVTLLGLSLSALAGDYTHSAPAVSGYDVVSYQTEKRPLRGNGHFVATHDGATYLFVNQDNLDAFKADPERYVPAYGGYCAFGVSVGKKFVGDPEVWRVVGGKLYLNLDANIQADWLKDVPGRIAKANARWDEIKDENPASL
ncbi:MAG: YHS domain protein [Gammaproteobacteria bacterium]|nr:YHS domain protein [Gammaproteobacteria bacterium]